MNIEEFRLNLGNNLKRLRKRCGLTQGALAEILGLETHNLNRIENGKSFPRAETLVNIINYFKIQPYELFLTENDAISEILDGLEKHPGRVKDIHKILMALTSNES